MRVAVVGGTGLVGRYTVESLERTGHEAVVVARSRGVDVATGAGLDGALAGVEAVIDVTNKTATDPDVAREFFGATTGQLLAAERRAGVGHHVVLSIVGVDLVEGNAHYAGKRRQEELVEAGSIPFTILRATQFHEFAEMVVGWTREGDVATVPPLLAQPLAASDVGRVLAEIATGPPQGRAPDLAGPETQDLVDMARRALAARGESVRLAPSWREGPFGVEMAGEVLLPGPDARIAPTTFDAWLATR
ncbi:MAG: SDR family oxidoreductase [Rubrobacteraceae bacterium]